MKGIFEKTEGGVLFPSDEETQANMEKFKTGEHYRVTITKERSLPFLRKYMALVSLVFENCDRFTNKEQVLTELKLQTGHYEEHVTLGGKLIYKPKSIAFESMDDVEFANFYDKSLDVIIKHFIVGTTKADIEKMLNQVATFF